MTLKPCVSPGSAWYFRVLIVTVSCGAAQVHWLAPVKSVCQPPTGLYLVLLIAFSKRSQRWLVRNSSKVRSAR